jgi:hypothetical protein
MIEVTSDESIAWHNLRVLSCKYKKKRNAAQRNHLRMITFKDKGLGCQFLGLKENERTTFEQRLLNGNSFPNRAYVIDILHGSNDVNLL